MNYDPIAVAREKARREMRLKYEHSLKAFTFRVWPMLEPGTELKWNWHLDVMCAYIERWYHGDLINGSKNLIINVPPGTMKSLLLSVISTAWAWTWKPHERFINLTNEIGLATRDSTKMRFIVNSSWYQALWGDRVRLTAEQREKTYFTTEATGFRQGLGFNANITGKRGSKLLIDDPIDAKKAFSDVEIIGINDTYDQVVSSRLSDPVEDGKCLIMQRLRTNDLTGHLIGKTKQKFTHLVIPMRYEGFKAYDPVADLGPEYAHLIDPRTTKGELLWPDRFPEAVVLALEEDLGEYGTAGQLQQRPVPAGGGILKKKWWRVWGKTTETKNLPFPQPLHVVCSMDTALSERDLKENAFSAVTVWSVFEMPGPGPTRYGMLLLDTWHKRVGYPELREKTLAVAKKHLSFEKGDAILIESKASGISLIQDLRRNRKLFVRGYDPKPDGDKVARAHLAAPHVKAGTVFIPDKPWAHTLVDILSEFPAGGPPCSDLTDTTTQAIRYVTKRRWIEHPDDIDEELEEIEDGKIVSAYG